MRLHDYLLSPGALSPEALCASAGIPNVDQVRQWRHGYGGRVPSPANCLAIERATASAVTRADLRPDDYWLIWPDLSAPKPKTKLRRRPKEEAAEARTHDRRTPPNLPMQLTASGQDVAAAPAEQAVD